MLVKRRINKTAPLALTAVYAAGDRRGWDSSRSDPMTGAWGIRLRFGGFGLAYALLQSLFATLAFALQFLVALNFLVGHGKLLMLMYWARDLVRLQASFVKDHMA
jgi:hypothetical protein